MTSIVRIEIEKLQKFEVVDRYEIDNYYKSSNLDRNNCMSKSCVLAAGHNLNLDFVVSSTVEKIGRMLAISLRQYNVKSGAQEAAVVKEYIYEPVELQALVRFAIESLFGAPINTELENLYLLQKHEADLVDKPNVRKLNLSGPRFGVSVLTDQNSSILQAPKNKGGFDISPLMTQFCYHTELRYMNTGNVMALVEFFGLVGGMEQQNLFPPCLSSTVFVGRNQNGNSALVRHSTFNSAFLIFTTRTTPGAWSRINTMGSLKAKT